MYSDMKYNRQNIFINTTCFQAGLESIPLVYFIYKYDQELTEIYDKLWFSQNICSQYYTETMT